ncbi:TFIID-18kDa-domain-containing protein [Microstroma glucosiphilum]|uniref:TFIID-18kDa-domain-containing protein n=1 Tax=Pseudomicrostroma glucosiphilum TaxID=1684307 RepID=A0A316U169_9BASI|nr:TFIID-18kDa-domain-containing protein [Pseudomicrostroma glucosiphilum]PWN19129.1 TFIID-18kDa-domain-containing protein [Pseudomicrostroma glucosiphilum]
MPPSPDDAELDGPIASTSAAVQGETSQEGYMYTHELSQMMFVFAHVVDPSKPVLHLLEDIVRHQVVQMIIQARNLSVMRRSRHLSTEDLIFLVRYDRAKVNRLRTYLSWKDVRKNAKDDGGGGAGGEVDLNAAVEDADAAKAQGGISRKLKVKLPWEISTIYSDCIVSGAGASLEQSQSGGGGLNSDLPPELEAAAAKVQQPTVDEELDEDDQEAMKESLMRLREADQVTLKMTREEYEHYSDCRTASFTFRKGKRFRDFLGSSNYLDMKPNDDIVDILGFLAYEVVREITIGAKQVWEQERAVLRRGERREPKPKKIKRTHEKSAAATEAEPKVPAEEADDPTQGSSSGQKEEEKDEESTAPAKASQSEAKSGATKSEKGRTGSPLRATRASDDSASDGGEVDIEQLYSAGKGQTDGDEASSVDPASFCGLFSLASADVGDGDGPLVTATSHKSAHDTSAASPSKRPLASDHGKDADGKETADGGTEPDDEGDDEDEEEKETSPDLLVHHIRESFARMERQKTQPSLSAGVRVSGPFGGLRKTKVFVL